MNALGISKVREFFGAVNRQDKIQDSSKSILQTQYHQDHVNMNTAKHFYRHSSYNPVMEVDHGKMKPLDESLHTVPKQKDCHERKAANQKTVETGKYFDNLVALIEEAARGLDY